MTSCVEPALPSLPQSVAVLTESEVARALIEGEPWAATAVWNAHAPKVFRIVARVLGPGADAEDVTHEVFVRVFSRVSGLRDPMRWELRVLGDRPTPEMGAPAAGA